MLCWNKVAFYSYHSFTITHHLVAAGRPC